MREATGARAAVRTSWRHPRGRYHYRPTDLGEYEKLYSTRHGCVEAVVVVVIVVVVVAVVAVVAVVVVVFIVPLRVGPAGGGEIVRWR